MTEQLLSIEEAATYLGIPKATLQKKVTAGKVPHTRIFKHVRFTQEHLAQIVAQGERPVSAPTPRRRGAARARL